MLWNWYYDTNNSNTIETKIETDYEWTWISMPVKYVTFLLFKWHVIKNIEEKNNKTI